MPERLATLPEGVTPSRLLALVEHSWDILSLLDGEGRLLFNSPAAQRIHGFTPEEMEGRNTFDFIHPEDQPKVSEAMGQCLSDPGHPVWVQYRYAHKARGWMWMEAVALNLLKHPEVQAIVVNSRDISDRMEAQASAQALTDSQSRYLALFSHMTQGFAFCQMIFEGDQPIDWVYQEVNPSFLTLTGLPDPTGRRVTEVIPGIRDADPELFRRYGRVVTTGVPTQFETFVASLGLWFSVSVYRPMAGHFVAVFDVINARKQAEEARLELERQLQRTQKLESLGSLAGGIAHDMNNVLGSILGLASLYEETLPQGAAAQEAFATIAQACLRGGGMVRRLLDFARQDLSEVKILDLNQLVREEVRLLERTTLSHVRYHLLLAEDLHPVRGDGAALTHALMNLCVNAVDAMPEGGTLVLSTRNGPAGSVELEVEDTGAGMPREVLDKALDPFFTTKPQGKGTGLGLAIVFGTMKAHQGSVELTSEVGRGTRVILRFPACEPSGGEELPDATFHPPTAAALEVLLVDDDELVRGSVEAVLRSLGHRVTCQPSGEAALAWLASGPRPQVIILDINMPGMGGAEALRRIRAVYGEVPVILATGRVDPAAQDLATAYPRVSLVPKPFTRGQLRSHLESLE